jgi:hypothetical protein
MGNTGVSVLQWDHGTGACAMPVFNSLAHLEQQPELFVDEGAARAVPPGGALW